MHQPSDAIQSSAAPAPQQQQPEQQGGERATAAGGRDERATSSSQGNGPHPPGLLSAQEPQGDYGSEQEDSDEGDGGGGGGGGGGRYDCHAMLANAAVHGHEFGWHQDADPQTFPLSSAFTRQYGQYANRVRPAGATSQFPAAPCLWRRFMWQRNVCAVCRSPASPCL